MKDGKREDSPRKEENRGEMLAFERTLIILKQNRCTSFGDRRSETEEIYICLAK